VSHKDLSFYFAAVEKIRIVFMRASTILYTCKTNILYRCTLFIFLHDMRTILINRGLPIFIYHWRPNTKTVYFDSDTILFFFNSSFFSLRFYFLKLNFDWFHMGYCSVKEEIIHLFDTWFYKIKFYFINLEHEKV